MIALTAVFMQITRAEISLSEQVLAAISIIAIWALMEVVAVYDAGSSYRFLLWSRYTVTSPRRIRDVVLVCVHTVEDQYVYTPLDHDEEADETSFTFRKVKYVFNKDERCFE